MCTHLHWDHVGWNTQLIDGRWVPTFPNAKHIISRTEYDYWDAAYRRGDPSIHCLSFEDSVIPGRRRPSRSCWSMTTTDSTTASRWSPASDTRPATSSSTSPISACTEPLPATSSLHQIQFRFPSMSTKADTDPNLARKTRTALIEKLARTGSLLLPAHFPDADDRQDRASAPRLSLRARRLTNEGARRQSASTRRVPRRGVRHPAESTVG